MNISGTRNRFLKKILLDHTFSGILLKALSMPWKLSDKYDYLAWTDFKSIFINDGKLMPMLEGIENLRKQVLIQCLIMHEVLHNQWLHDIRGKDKQNQGAWTKACEYAINLYIAAEIGDKDYKWVKELGGIYPDKELFEYMRQNAIPATTEGFYKALTETAHQDKSGGCKCPFHLHVGGERDPDPAHLLQTILTAQDDEETEDIRQFLLDRTAAPEQKVPWDQVLLGGIENAVNLERSFSRPSRRNSELPGRQHEKLLSFVWILDVSPSIDDEMKNSFMATLQAGINKYHDASHRVIFFADSVEQDITISAGTDVSSIEVPSGNGTCLIDVWEILEKDHPEYALVLTDLELSEVPKPSRTHVVWGVVGDYACWEPDYGTIINLD